MTARVLTGSKEEIARQVATLEGDVREVVVFIHEPAEVAHPPAETVEDLFAEMEPYTVKVADFDDSREAIYQPAEGE